MTPTFSLPDYLKELGIPLAYGRPERIITGPFFFATTLDGATGAVNLNLSLGAGLTDPSLRMEFGQNPAAALPDRPQFSLQINDFSVYVADNGALTDAQFAALSTSLVLDTTVASARRVYSSVRRLQSLRDLEALDNMAAPTRGLNAHRDAPAFTRPRVINLNADACSLVTLTPLGALAGSVPLILRVEGVAFGNEYNRNGYGGTDCADSGSTSQRRSFNLGLRLRGLSARPARRE